MEKALNSDCFMNDDGSPMDVPTDVRLSYDEEVENGENEEGINKEEDNFLKAASTSVLHQCISEFIDTTGNNVVRLHVCMICTRELWTKDVEHCAVDDIPNEHLLAPNKYHPHHKLTSGMLLETNVMDRKKGRLFGDVCHDCT
jgi:hypothetical protein